MVVMLVVIVLLVVMPVVRMLVFIILPGVVLVSRTSGDLKCRIFRAPTVLPLHPHWLHPYRSSRLWILIT